MLLAILTCQRCQTMFDIRNSTLTADCVTIRIGDLIKQSRPGHHIGPIKLQAFAQDSRLCVVHTLTEYINRTESMRQGETRLFLAISKLLLIGSEMCSNCPGWMCLCTNLTVPEARLYQWLRQLTYL